MNGNYLRLRDDDDYLEFSAPGFEDPRVIYTVIALFASLKSHG
jgi:hypothetical protein